MNWNQNGTLTLSKTDLAVLQSDAFARKPGNRAVFQGGGLGIPPVPSAEVFTLLTCSPSSEKNFWAFYRTVLEHSNHPERYYFRSRIDRNGKSRNIACPLRGMELFQRWILKNILEKLPVSPQAYAYRKGLSLRDHAERHLGKAVMVKLDIRHFFDSVSYRQVYRVFSELAHYPPEGAALMAHLCCLDGHLPQGAPTSPCLSNLCMVWADKKIEAYCRERGITYTRYSDDMIFSADSMDPAGLIRHVKEVLRHYGYHLNHDKIRVLGKGSQHKVTGVVCNEKISVDAAYRRKLRQEIYFLNRFGPQEHIRRMNDPRYLNKNGEPMTETYYESLTGRVAYVVQIMPDNQEFQKYLDDLRLRPTRELLKRLGIQLDLKYKDGVLSFSDPDGDDDLPF